VKKTGTNAIKKKKDKSKEDQLKNDYEELKALLKLDIGQEMMNVTEEHDK